jgi:hypothetical protein
LSKIVLSDMVCQKQWQKKLWDITVYAYLINVDWSVLFVDIKNAIGDVILNMFGGDIVFCISADGFVWI